MTSLDPAPSTADVAALPANPTVYRRKGVGPGFWLLLILGVIILAGGVFLGLYAAKLFPKAASSVTPTAANLPWRAATGEPLDAPATTGAAEAPPPAAIQPPRLAGDVNGLSERLTRLEAGQDRLARSATGALATAALVQAAQTSRPFTAELTAVDGLLPDAGDVAALRRIALTGAPTRAALASEFPAAAAKAIAAAKKPDDKSGLIERVRHAIGSIVTIRRVDNPKGDGPHAVLARAESRVDEGDVEGALAELDALPAPAREALSTWRIRAERRAEIDRRLANIREVSLRSLKESLEARP